MSDVAGRRRLEQYLGRHAEPEAALAARVPGRYRRVLVVPVHREDPALIDGYARAAERADGRTLCVLVVNDTRVLPDNARLLTEIVARLSDVRLLASEPPLRFGRHAAFDVLVLDRVSPGFTLPLRQGVGLARKIGGDLALALWHTGRVESRWLFSSDADVRLPDDYFSGVDAVPPAAVAALYGFWHAPSGEPDVDRATALYEISLRYYVLGLRAAGSPYAMHSIGSTICVDAEAYAAVRGFPRRVAGEDFYMLDKLAKLGPIAGAGGEPIAIRSRRSDRVPFGTGRGVGRLLETGTLALYDPVTFELLATFLAALDDFAAHGEPSRFLAALRGSRGPGAVLLPELAQAWQLEQVLAAAAGQAADSAQLLRRVHTWFDAFRTLKFVHALRERALPSLDWRLALERAGFLLRGLGQIEDLDRIRRVMLQAETEPGRRFGPPGMGAL